ncbi:MAG TPA: cyclase family protein [Streptosporangiaceae bacterium]|jgi:kynurenine formamidase
MTEPGGGGPARAGRLTAGQFRELYDRLRAVPEWGARDRRGALNFITPDVVAAACRDVTLGRSVSLAAPIEDRAGPDNPQPASHHMNTGQDVPPGAPGLTFAADRLALNIHGDADSHLDALCHVIYDGHLYNGVDARVVTPDGAQEESVAVAADGIVGRGVLLDIPRLRGLPWLEPGEHVTADDLASAEAAQRVRVGRGDLLFVRTGHRKRKHEAGAWDVTASRAGLHPTALEFVAEREVAVLGSDSNSDAEPSAADGTDFPVHVLAINALGVHLLDYLQFEGLVPLCEAADRWSFLCVVAPLRIPGGTGSPVNPIAVM